MPMRRIKEAKIRFISLVPRGANQLPVIYKADDSTVEFETIVKDDMTEQGTITSIVYAPESRDSQGDIASAEVIKKMAYEFAKNGEGVDLRHDNKALSSDQAYVAENFIVQKGDPRFSDIKNYDGEAVDVTGAWAVVIKVDDEALRKEFRDGNWNGVSMGGTAVVESEKADDGFTSRFFEAFKNFLGRQDEGDLDMKTEDLTKALDASNEKLVAALTKIMKPDGESTVAKEDETKETPAAPVFKGDMSNEDDRKAFKKELALWEASQKHADNPVALFEAMEKIEEEFSESNSEIDEAAGVSKEDNAEVADLKRRLHKAEKRSNQTTGDRGETNNTPIESGVGITKSDAELLAAGANSVSAWYGNDEN